MPPSSGGGLSLREPDAKGYFLAVSTVSPAISGKVLTCATTAVATTTVQNIAESAFACTRTVSTGASGCRISCPCFPLMADTGPLRLPSCGNCTEVQPRQSDLRAGRMFFGLKAPSRRGEVATGAGRWRILFTVSPRSFMVLFFGRLCEPRAERAVSGPVTVVALPGAVKN